MFKYFLVAFLLTGLVACAPAETSNSETVTLEDKVLVIGDISREPTETMAYWEPFVKHLEANLADDGIIRVEVAVAPNLGTMIQWLKSGEVDIYIDSPYPALVMSEETGAEPLLRRFKKGVSEYHSVFFAREDSEIHSVEDIQGQMLALEENYSTSGYMLPITHILEKGMEPTVKYELTNIVIPSEIGFIFSGDDDLTIEWVLNGDVSAGVVDNITYAEIPEGDRDELRIIAQTEEVPRQMVMVRKGLDEALTTAIYDELLAMDESEKGLTVLEAIETTQFDTFPDGVEPAMARMREMYEILYIIEG